MMKRIVKNNYFLWGTLFLFILFLAVQTGLFGIALFRSIQADPSLVHPVWRWIDSPLGLRFLERFPFLVGCLAISGILIFQKSRRTIGFVPLVLLAEIAGSMAILRSEAVGAETHSGKVLGAANFALISIGLFLPVLALILIFSGQKRTITQKRNLSGLWNQSNHQQEGEQRQK